MKNKLLLFSLLLFSFVAIWSCNSIVEDKENTSSKKMDIIAYYYGDSSGFKTYDTKQLTHIIYSFLQLKGNKIAFNKPADSLAVVKLVSLKEEHPSLKVLISMGGWGSCETCSDVFSTEQGRTAFSQSVKNMLEATHTDGIDLDWEYPSIEGFPGHRFTPEDKHNFTLLLETLRKTIGDSYEISFAAGGYTEYLQKSIEWDKVMPLVNRVNLMSYDLTNGYSVLTGHHTPLYSTPQQVESTDHGVRYLDSIGVPLNKVVIGAAFYARVFEQVDSTHHGLHQSCKFKTCFNYKNFKDSLSPDLGFTYYWDSIAKAPYAYSPNKKEFATFDNKESVALKVQYVRDKKLGGIMFWELTEDKEQKGLLNVMYEIMIGEHNTDKPSAQMPLRN
ncbi:MAG TPA: glycoside hydrolase family 18 protein [Cytophagaceae bacterium]|jgi:chitinase|nr:glycoside hydrolase family 18 protein [Cytophagaceae bacterium]